MGTNPRAVNADLTGVYYDGNGDVACIVHADNDDFTPHQYQGLSGVNVPYTAYAAAAPAITFKGRPKHHALSKAIIAYIQQQRPVLAAIVQARIDAFENWFSDVATAKANYQAAFDAFWNALTLAHKVAWNNVDTLASLVVFLNALSAAERAAYDAMVSARQAYVDALQAGPNP
jgi:hypothetical protein